jgi:ribosomal protein S18 acetylase RimI-like enzyme
LISEQNNFEINKNEIMSVIKIRELTNFSIREFHAVKNILPQLDNKNSTLTKEHYKGILKSENSHLFLAELNDFEIIGMFTLGTYKTPLSTKVWIEDVVIDKEYTGKGYGKRMILFAIEFTKLLGAEALELTSRPTRIAANKLYQKLGFKKQNTNKYKYVIK